MSPLLHAFGPGDITCIAVVPGKAYVLNEVTDFSISSHFDKVPVRRLGHRLPQGWATGAGSIAGTLVCAQFTNGALWKLRRHAAMAKLAGDDLVGVESTSDVDRARLEFFTGSILPQQLPPFHLIFVHQNTAGQMAIARLYDVVLSDLGEVKGANNAYTEETLQFQALFYEQIRLHKSLTLEDMGRLAGIQTTAFNERRVPESLAESVITTISEGPGSRDPLSYILSETEMLQTRLREGQDTSISIADQGDVVWVGNKNADSGEINKMYKIRPHDPGHVPSAKEDEYELNLNITDIIAYQLGQNTTTATVDATLAVRGERVWLIPRVDSPTTDDFLTGEFLGRLTASKDNNWTVTGQDTTYAEAMLRVGGFPTAKPRLTASSFTLTTTDQNEIFLKRTFSDGIIQVRGYLNLDRPDAFTGTYKAVGDAISESYTATLVDGELKMSGKLGPFSAPLVSPISSNDSQHTFNLSFSGTVFGKSHQFTSQVLMYTHDGAIIAYRRQLLQNSEPIRTGAILGTLSNTTDGTQATIRTSLGNSKIEIELDTGFQSSELYVNSPNITVRIIQNDETITKVFSNALRASSGAGRSAMMTLQKDLKIVPGLTLLKEHTSFNNGSQFSYGLEFDPDYSIFCHLQGPVPQFSRVYRGQWRGEAVVLALDESGTSILSGSIGGVPVPVTAAPNATFQLLSNLNAYLDTNDPSRFIIEYSTTQIDV